MDDNLEIQKVEKQVEAIRKFSNDVDIENDYKYSRKTFEILLQQGQIAIEDALALAQSSDSPRAYEVVGGLIKTVGDVTDKLLDLQEKVKRLEEDPKSESIHTTNNNAVFVGNTSDLLEKLFRRGNDETS